MRPIEETKFYRILDANINRAKEGLRVCEDVCRFILDHQKSTQQWKALRHRLTALVSRLPMTKVLAARNIEHDVGKKSVTAEFQRKDTRDIFWANAQRVKESIRVLEELTKLRDKRLAQEFKKIRYHVYALEKKIIEQC